MPLQWTELLRRYANGAHVPTVAGGKTLDVTGADDEFVYVKGGSLWRDKIPREHLEAAVRLIENGTLSRRPVAFVEQYHEFIAPSRGTAVAHLLKDLGFLG